MLDNPKDTFLLVHKHLRMTCINRSQVNAMLGFLRRHGIWSVMLYTIYDGHIVNEQYVEC